MKKNMKHPLSEIWSEDLPVLKHGVLENGPLISDFPIQTSIYRGFPLPCVITRWHFKLIAFFETEPNFLAEKCERVSSGCSTHRCPFPSVAWLIEEQQAIAH